MMTVPDRIVPAMSPDRRPAADVFSFKLTAQSLIQAIGRGASSIALAPATVLAGIASSFEDQRFSALGTENIFCPYLVPGSRLDRLYLFRLFTASVEFILYFIVHIEEGIAYCHGAAGPLTRIAAGRTADRIARAVPCRIELVNDSVNINPRPGTDRNHAGQADHEVIAAACRTFAEIRFQQGPCFRIEEGNTVETATACDEFAFLADDIIIDSDDFTAAQSVPGDRYRLFIDVSR